jgi:hypothetical protein
MIRIINTMRAEFKLYKTTIAESQKHGHVRSMAALRLRRLIRKISIAWTRGRVQFLTRVTPPLYFPRQPQASSLHRDTAACHLLHCTTGSMPSTW